MATSKLGYFTDNGAMLYGGAWGDLGQKNGGNLHCCNESVMHRVLSGLSARHIPYNWIQMDDWSVAAIQRLCLQFVQTMHSNAAAIQPARGVLAPLCILSMLRSVDNVWSVLVVP